MIGIVDDKQRKVLIIVRNFNKMKDRNLNIEELIFYTGFTKEEVENALLQLENKKCLKMENGRIILNQAIR